MTAPRFLLYSHDGCGLGHARRNLAIAAAIVREAPDACVVLATGCIELGTHGLAPNVEILGLPSLRKLGNGRYGPRRLPISPDELRAIRAGLIQTTVESFRPDVLLIDKHPMGVRGELRPALTALRASGGQAVLGLRDILDDPMTVRAEWSRDGVIEFTEAHCERVLVYGDPDVFDLVGQYGVPATLARRVRYCGYVVAAQDAGRLRPLSPATRRPKVLATAGGGEDGRRLLETFARASEAAPWDAGMVAGPQSSPGDREALRRIAAGAGVEFRDSVPDLPSLLQHADALVSMGGYNTLGEALSLGIPTLCVPRAHPRSEQLIRARLFDSLGLLRVIEPARLTPAVVRARLAALLRSDRSALASRAEATLGFGGARAAATTLLELATGDLAVSSPARCAS